MKKLGVVLVAGLIGSNLALAQSVSETEVDVLEKRTKKFWLFLGADGGYTTFTSDFGAADLEKDGYQLGVKAVGSYYLTNWVFDLGGGWLFSSLNNVNNDARSRTRAGYAEISPRYRLSESFQLGLGSQLIFGNDIDTTLTGEERNDEITGLAGIKAVYETDIGDTWALRLGARILTDFTISDRQLTTGILDVQIGLPIIGGGSEPAKRKVIAEKPLDEIEITQSAPTAPVVVRVPYHLKDSGLNFDTASSDLSDEVKIFLMKLGAYLEENQSNWKSASVHGHADQRGNEVMNQALSEKRAGSVLEALAAGGTTSTKLAAVGHGESQLLDERNIPEAWDKNRRVEIKFEGVEDVETLSNDILTIRNQF